MAWVPKRPSGPWPLETEAASNSSWALGHQPGRLETWGHQGANPMPCWKTTVLHDSRCRHGAAGNWGWLQEGLVAIIWNLEQLKGDNQKTPVTTNRGPASGERFKKKHLQDQQLNFPKRFGEEFFGPIWVFPKIMVPPKSSHFNIEFSIINHPFWGTKF